MRMDVFAKYLDLSLILRPLDAVGWLAERTWEDDGGSVRREPPRPRKAGPEGLKPVRTWWGRRGARA